MYIGTLHLWAEGGGGRGREREGGREQSISVSIGDYTTRHNNITTHYWLCTKQLPYTEARIMHTYSLIPRPSLSLSSIQMHQYNLFLFWRQERKN